MQIFFSRVSSEFEFVDRFFGATFGHLPQFRLVTQTTIEENISGWHTLDKLCDELQKVAVVVHLIGSQVGARPKREADVRGFLHCQPLRCRENWQGVRRKSNPHFPKSNTPRRHRRQ